MCTTCGCGPEELPDHVHDHDGPENSHHVHEHDHPHGHGHDHGHDQHGRCLDGGAGLVEEGIDFRFKQDTGNTAGNGADDHEPGQPPVRVRAYLALFDTHEPGLDEPDPIGGKEKHHGKQGADVQGHVESQAGQRRVGPTEKPWHDDQVCGT